MSELKAKSSGEIRARDALLGYWWYEKCEADKVIAELQSKTTLASLADDCSSLLHKRCNYCSELQRQKYKRCLAMAEKCDARYDEEDAKVNGHAASWEYISKEMKYWERWRNRWLAIAEKLKEVQ